MSWWSVHFLFNKTIDCHLIPYGVGSSIMTGLVRKRNKTNRDRGHTCTQVGNATCHTDRIVMN